MIPTCFDGSDAVNWISRVPVVVGGDPPNRVVSDDERSDPGGYRRIVFFGDKIGGCDKKEFEMALQDRVMEETKDKKNAVEAYVYDMRNKLHDKYHEFVTKSDREQLISRLQEVEDWLYEDGEDETKGVYIAKLDELKKQVDPIEERFKEHSERGTVINQLIYCINSYREATRSNDSKCDHIDLAEKQKVLSDCVEAEAWLREKQQHQDTLPKYMTLVLLSAEVKKKAESLDRSCRPIKMKPKPAAKPSTPEPVPTERGMEVECITLVRKSKLGKGWGSGRMMVLEFKEQVLLWAV
ncbi:heat shock 70 kDa protein 15-like [Salvia splendens]|uniref:heat shock 70 kDa protein 15-like n=1 Tax=Salvia splendens TaxID=180675 RepID=UPI001C27AB6A|nr:heat shock 70 kDa protein 15-like [Salvia splendens]